MEEKYVQPYSKCRRKCAVMRDFASARMRKFFVSGSGPGRHNNCQRLFFFPLKELVLINPYLSLAPSAWEEFCGRSWYRIPNRLEESCIFLKQQALYQSKEGTFFAASDSLCKETKKKMELFSSCGLRGFFVVLRCTSCKGYRWRSSTHSSEQNYVSPFRKWMSIH